MLDLVASVSMAVFATQSEIRVFTALHEYTSVLLCVDKVELVSIDSIGTYAAFVIKLFTALHEYTPVSLSLGS